MPCAITLGLGSGILVACCPLQSAMVQLVRPLERAPTFPGAAGDTVPLLWSPERRLPRPTPAPSVPAGLGRDCRQAYECSFFLILILGTTLLDALNCPPPNIELGFWDEEVKIHKQRRDEGHPCHPDTVIPIMSR